MMFEPNPRRGESSRRPFQFRLSYLLYLTTLCAIGFTLLRNVLALRGGWLAMTVGTLYVAALMVYFGVRVPFLIGRLRRGAREAAARRQQLADLLAHARRGDQDSADHL
jgi:hypothetical protein